MTISKVDFIGLGALGVIYGNHLEEKLGPGSVRFWADKDRVARYKKDGIYCNGKACAFEYLSPDEVKEPVKLLIFSVKSTALLDAIEIAKPIVDENTIIVSILNGLTSEEIIEKGLGKGRIVPCTAQVSATKAGNKVTCVNIGLLRIGLIDKSPRLVAAINELMELFDATKFPYIHEDDIVHRLWLKWMFNVGGNQATMVYKANFDKLMQPGEVRDVYIAAMKEVQTLSKAAGVNITDQELEDYIRSTDSLNPTGTSSMRQDGMAHRKSEVELFAETVVAMGKKYGVPTPVNDMLLAKIREMEAQY